MRYSQLSRLTQAALMLLGGVLVCAVPLQAQVQFDNLNMTASGVVSASYVGDYGNLTSSDHSLGVGATGAIAGYYFNPNFLSFNANPYYNQSRDNSTSFATSNSSGVDSSVAIFSGSHFPGNFNYSNSFNSSGSFDVPGMANFTTHGSSESYGINWAERLPSLPKLSVSFSKTGGENSIFGEIKTDTTSAHNFNLNGSYSVLGFGLNASYYIGASSSEFPNLFTSQTETTSTRATDHGYSLTASRGLFWNGSMFSSFTSSTAHTFDSNLQESYSVDNLNAGSSFHPIRNFSLSDGFTYSSSLSGNIEQQLLSSGVVVPVSFEAPAGHAYGFTAAAGYTPLPHLLVSGEFQRRVQQYNGTTYGDNTYDASASYFHILFGGNLNAGLTLIDGTSSTVSGNTLGFSANGTYSRKVGQWRTNANFDYTQNVTSLLVTYTTSGYGYSGNLRRKWQFYSVAFGAGGSRTGLSQGGAANESNNVNTGIGLGKWASLSASYSTSSGSGLLGAAGITQTPVPPTLLPVTSMILFGGKSYSYSIGATPLSRLTLSAAYSRGESTSSTTGTPTFQNSTEVFNALVQYQFRKMYISGGYSKLIQGFSSTGVAPQQFSNYYISISRWFKFF